MRKLFDDAKKDLEGFLGQRDKAILILSTSGMQLAYLIKMLKDIEDSGSPDIFLIFPQDFTSQQRFASLVVERVKLSYEAAKKETGLSDNTDRLISFPAVCTDERQSPALRIREALIFARSLIPANQGKRLVCGILPLTIENYSEYKEMVLRLCAFKEISPWYRGMRLLFKQEQTAPALPSLVQNHPFTVFKSYDFSTEAMTESLQQEVESPDLPAEQRAQSLLQLACIDYAHKRYDAAMEKYTALLAYYQQTQNVTLQAIVLTGIGDIYNRMKDLPAARQWYECALPPAGESANPIVLFTVARNLGHVHYQQGNFPEAETFFDGAQQLGLHTHDPEAKILSLEWRGLSQEKQNLHTKAVDSYEQAATLAFDFNRPEHLQRNYEHLEKILKHFNQKQRLVDVRRRLLSKIRETGNVAARTPLSDSGTADARAAG